MILSRRQVITISCGTSSCQSRLPDICTLQEGCGAVAIWKRQKTAVRHNKQLTSACIRETCKTPVLVLCSNQHSCIQRDAARHRFFLLCSNQHSCIQRDAAGHWFFYSAQTNSCIHIKGWMIWTCVWEPSSSYMSYLQ